MDRAAYFEFLRETSEAVYPVILRRTENTEGVEAGLREVLSFFIRRKLETPSLKASLLRLSYEACGGGHWQRVIPAAAAFELVNISSYQANSAFDSKLGILERSDRDSQFIASMITREMASEVAAQLAGAYDDGTVKRVQGALGLSNRYVYVAQHYDLNLLTVRRLQKYGEEPMFRKHYLERCRYGSGVFNGQCAYVGGLLAGACVERLEALRGFGEEFGTALQVVNDLGDYLPRDEHDRLARSFQDRYSDFKNGRLTAPLYHVLNLGHCEASRNVQALIDSGTFDEGRLVGVTKLLIHEGSFLYASAMARGAAKRARAYARVLPDGTARALLLTMLSMIQSNKYFVELRKLAEARAPV